MSKKMFLLDHGIIMVRTDDGDELTFKDAATFNAFFPDTDLTGKTYIDYEPDKMIYFDKSISEDNLAAVPGTIPDEKWEAVIAEAALRKDEIENPYSLLSLAAAKKLKSQEIMEKYHTDFFNKWPMMVALDALAGDDVSKLNKDVAADLAAAVTAMNADLAEIAEAATVDDVTKIEKVK